MLALTPNAIDQQLADKEMFTTADRHFYCGSGPFATRKYR